jgi:hypothetical protein
VGRFEYGDTGTLDRTHMRFFTRGSFYRFLGDAGLAVDRSRVTPGILRPFVPLVKRLYGAKSETARQSDSSSIMDSAPYRSYPLERAICALWPGLLAFQFVILARPSSVANLQCESQADQSVAGLSV